MAAPLVLERRLRRTGLSNVAHWLESTGSAVAAHGLTCSTACGVFGVREFCSDRWILSH